METKFTRGEWIADSSLNIINGYKGFVIADVTGDEITHFIGNMEEAKANAKLIAKSPQMFETITNFIHWIEREKETVSGALLAEMDSAKKLIKKITE